MSRIQEISADDVDDFDFPLEASNVPGSSSDSPSGFTNSFPSGNMGDLSSMLAGMMGATGVGLGAPQKQNIDRSRWKNWETIYPRYLDGKVSYKTGGRRVNLNYSLRWPLAHHIHEICTQFGFQSQLESDKTHPSDWGNPGRVRVLIKKNGKPINSSVPNKLKLLCKIGSILRPLESQRLKLPMLTAENRNLATSLPRIGLRLPYSSPAISHGFLAMAEAEAAANPTPSDPTPTVSTGKQKTVDSGSGTSQKKTTTKTPKKGKKSKK